MLSRIALSFLVLAIASQVSDPIAQRPVHPPSLPAGEPVDPGPGTGSSPGPDTISVIGSERLTWDYFANSLADVRRLGFVAQVDDQFTDLQTVDCQPSEDEWRFVCSTPMPVLELGIHTIAVSAFEVVEGARVIGYPSASLTVERIAPTASSASSAETVRVQILAAPETARLAEVANLHDPPTAMAALSDGRLLLAERSGIIRVFARGTVLDPPAARLDDVDARDGRGVLAIAADVSLDRHPFVYVLYTVSSGLRLARLTLSGDTLQGRMTLADGLPLSPARPSAAIAMGPDERLYVALDDGGDPNRAFDMGSFAGKVLRLERDGTTPKEPGTATPVFAAGFSRPVGLTWDRNGRTLWVVEGDASGTGKVSVVTASESGQGRTTASYTAPSALASAVGVAHGQGASAHQDLLLTVTSGSSLVRMHFKPSGQFDRAQRLQVTELRSLAVASDNVIYASTAASLVRVRLAPENMK
jgi:hypothetical protein